MSRILVALAALFLLAGCGAKRGQAHGTASMERASGEGMGFAMEADQAAPRAVGGSYRAKAASALAPAAPPPPADREPAADARMVHHNAELTLRVPRLQEGVSAAEALAAEHGGRVEQVYGATVVIRVPVERFEQALEAALALGELVDRRISAADVTASFQDTELRLRIARATLGRLQALLAQVTEEEEKLRLLREIQRLREEIDELEGRARTLSELAAMSRIVVSLIPREALAWQGAEEETEELTWIRELSPFSTVLAVDARPLRLEAPEGLVSLTRRGPFVAESADGTRLWTHRIPNRPAGDAAFWLAAIEERLARDFGEVEARELGGWRLLRLEDRSEEPYAWWIAVRVEGRRVHLLSAFFPDLAQEERHAPGIEALMDTGGVS